jgi:hypothetical protein
MAIKAVINHESGSVPAVTWQVKQPPNTFNAKCVSRHCLLAPVALNLL